MWKVHGNQNTLKSMIDKVMAILICGPLNTGLLDFEAMKKLHYASRHSGA